MNEPSWFGSYAMAVKCLGAKQQGGQAAEGREGIDRVGSGFPVGPGYLPA